MIIRDLGEFSGISARTNNPWKKHEWLMETTGQYPRKVKFTVFGDRTNTVTFECGKSYVVQVDVESREYNERWYTDLTAYAARPIENNMGPVGPTTISSPAQNSNISQDMGPAQEAPKNPFERNVDFAQSNEQDDLPF